MSKTDRLRIDASCAADWYAMKGDDQVRFCEECNRYVHNFSRMPRQHVEAILASTPERVCARFLLDKNDSPIFLDPVGPVQIQPRRLSPVASAVVTAILAVNTGATPLVFSSLPASAYAESDPQSKAGRKQTGGTAASIAGSVRDPKKNPVAGATMMLINEKTGEAWTGASDQEGAFRFSGLSAGRYTLKVRAEKFEFFSQDRISLQDGQEQRLNVALEDQVVIMGMIGSPALPLRRLYDESQLIAVAQAGQSEDVEAAKYGSLVKTELFISQSIKGENKAMVYVYHWVYENKQTVLLPGENLLVFLQRQMPDRGKPALGGYAPIDSHYSLKKLSEAALKVYVSRLEELDEILQADEPDRKAIVEWLVRLAEDPVTQWEGSTELAWSLDDIEVEEPQEEASEELTQEEPSGEAKTVEIRIPSRKKSRARGFASLLTDEQKKRLTSALLDIESLAGDESDLIKLVSKWDSAKVVPFLIAQLRKHEDNPPAWTWTIVNTLSEILDDQKISELADDYNQNAPYDDITSEAEEDAEEESGEEVEEEAERIEETAEAEEEKALTPEEARRQRSEMLKKFLASCEQKFKQKQSESAQHDSAN
jgi:hypothetical protein